MTEQQKAILRFLKVWKSITTYPYADDDNNRLLYRVCVELVEADYIRVLDDAITHVTFTLAGGNQ
jgi:hypothetical protein